MQEVADIAGNFEGGSIPMWGTFITILGLVIKFWPVWKRLAMDVNDKLIADLRTDGETLRLQLHEVQREAAEYRKRCEAENDELREQMRHLRDDLAGLRRQIIQQQGATVIALSGADTPAARDAVSHAIEAGVPKA